jgi:hypothetical protein
MMGRTAIGSVANLLFYVLVFLVVPTAYPVFLLSLYGMKLITDRTSHVPYRYTLLAPVSYLLAGVLTADSIVGRRRGKLTWKGRNVSRSRRKIAGAAPSESISPS